MNTHCPGQLDNFGQFWTILFLHKNDDLFLFDIHAVQCSHIMYTKYESKCEYFYIDFFLKNDSNLLSKSKSNHSRVIYQRFYVKNEGKQQGHPLLGIEPCFPRKQQEFINQFFKKIC